MNLKFEGKLGRIYSIWFSNLILQIVTFMIYRPWAKTKMRKYLYGSISIFGEGLEYSGTGGELFKGSAKALLWLFLFSAIISIGIAIILGSENSILENVISFILIATLIYYAQYAALKYRLNRTRWRSIRSSLSGKALNYVKFRLKKAVFNIFTLGFLGGRVDLAAKEYIINNISTGSIKWKFAGDIKTLDNIHFITWILAIPTLGISRFWYKAALKNYTWSSTKIENISFSANYSAGKILKLYFGNILLFIITLGFGLPSILYRTVKFAVDNVEIIGNEADLQMLQSQQTSSATGDGLEGLVDSDSDYDLDWGIW